jgi:drug/metabolite transporter (DMT)-like permease
MTTLKPISSRKTLLADLGLLYAAAIWGSTFILVKTSLAHIDPLAMVAYRFLLAALVAGLFLVFQRKPLFQDFRRGLVLGVVLALLYIPQTIGLKFTSASNSAFITGLFVAFAPPLSLLLLKERTRLAQWIAVGISLVGLWLLTGGLSQINLGDIITLSAAFTYALHIILTDRFITARYDLYRLIFHQLLAVGVISLLISLAAGRPLGIGTTNTALAVIFLALFPTLSAFLIQIKAQQFTSPVKVSLIFALEPVFAGIFAWTLGGEPFIPLRALGGLLIFLAIVVSTVRPKTSASIDSLLTGN